MSVLFSLMLMALFCYFYSVKLEGQTSIIEAKSPSMNQINN